MVSDNLLDSDELTHDLLLGALSTWRTTWYLDNKWRDSNLENLVLVSGTLKCIKFKFGQTIYRYTHTYMISRFGNRRF